MAGARSLRREMRSTAMGGSKIVSESVEGSPRACSETLGTRSRLA